MNGSQQTTATRKSSMSAEALIGTGVTIGAFGILFLLLGWAQQMRMVKDAATILFAIGAVLFIIGAIVSMVGAGKRKTR